MGSCAATTSLTGEFVFKGVSAGDYEITGRGGDTGHWVSVPTAVSVAEGEKKAAGDVAVYNELGCGEVIQNSASIIGLSLCRGGVDQSRKGDIPPAGRYSEEDISSKGIYALQSMSNEVLQKNVALLYLKWEELVWDAAEEHAEDPAYDPEAPEAYLDLEDELAGYVDGVGKYYFKIEGTGGAGNTIKVLPVVEASLACCL
jgi:hypothetical protein